MVTQQQDIILTLPSGHSVRFAQGVTGVEIMHHSMLHPYRPVMGLEVNGRLHDVWQPIIGSASVRLLTWDDLWGKKIFWQSTAQLLAAALQALYPDVQLGIGKATAEGFY